MQVSLNQVLAAPFRYQKTGSLKRSAIIYYLVLEKKWMNKKQAEKILEIAEKNGLISLSGDDVSLLFDQEDLEIPLGFKPGSEIFETNEDPFSILVERIVEASGIEYDSVIGEIDRIAGEEFDGNLYRESAAFILAKRHNLHAGDLADPLYRQAFEKTN